MIAEEQRPSTTRVITRNFFWRGSDFLIGILGAFATTVALARVIGPQRLGYFNYVFWLTNMTGSIGSLGLPAATLKYMAEFRGRGQESVAKSVYFYCLKLQAAIAVSAAVLGVIGIWRFADPNYRWISTFLVLSIIPQMICFIPSQANTAAEDLAPNTRASLVGMVINIVSVALSLLMGWDLLGVAVGILLFRTADLSIKMLAVARRLKNVPDAELPPEVRSRLFSFSGKSSVLMLLQIIVWDRSDVVLLKFLQSDIKQVAFFSVSFSLAERLLLLPQTLGSALNATQMAEFGRNKERLFRMTAESTKYLLLFGLPMLLGGASVSGPIIRIIYGAKYIPAIPVFAVVAVFAISKSLLTPAQSLLYTTEDLNYLVWCGCCCGAVNILIDALLIPKYAAVGAAIGNGMAQTLAAGAIWWRAASKYNLRFQPGSLAKIVLAGLTMSVSALLFIRVSGSSAVLNLTGGVLLGAIVFLLVLRVLRALQTEDRRRLLIAGHSIPAFLRPWLEGIVKFLVPQRASAEATS